MGHPNGQVGNNHTKTNWGKGETVCAPDRKERGVSPIYTNKKTDPGAIGKGNKKHD